MLHSKHYHFSTTKLKRMSNQQTVKSNPPQALYSLTPSYTASIHRATACAPGSGLVSWLEWTLQALPALASIFDVAAVPALAACTEQEWYELFLASFPGCVCSLGMRLGLLSTALIVMTLKTGGMLGRTRGAQSTYAFLILAILTVNVPICTTIRVTTMAVSRSTYCTYIGNREFNL